MSLSVGVGNSAAAARDAFMAMLYVKDGLLRDTLVNVHRYPDPQNTVALLRHSGLAERGDKHPYVGVAVILANGHVMAYVHPDYRYKGWGAKLVHAARATTLVAADKHFARPGVDFAGTSNFWARLGIDCRQMDEPMKLRQSENDQLYKENRCLLYRAADKVPMQAYEEIYLARLFNTDYSEKQNGLQGQLHSIINEEYNPVDFVLFHIHQSAVVMPGQDIQLRQNYDSFATVETKLDEDQDGVVDVAHIQLFVAPERRRQGYGQEIIDLIRKRLPNYTLKGHYTPSSRSLYERNGIINLNWKPNDDTSHSSGTSEDGHRQ